jgi:hypothetical protein
MSKLLSALLICIFSVSTFSAHAADKRRSDVKKSQITPVQKQQKQSGDRVSDKPLSVQGYQTQTNDTLGVGPAEKTLPDMSPPKPTDVNYAPPPDLNDRNPISN